MNNLTKDNLQNEHCYFLKSISLKPPKNKPLNKKKYLRISSNELKNKIFKLNIDSNDDREEFHDLIVRCCVNGQETFLKNIFSLFRNKPFILKDLLNITIGNLNNSCLIYTCMYCNSYSIYNIVKLLIEHGAYINYENSNLKNCLFFLCNREDIKDRYIIIKYLIFSGVNTSFGGFSKKPILLNLIKLSNLSKNELILLAKNTKNINKFNKYGKNILIYAIQKKYINISKKDIINILLENGADPSLSNNEGLTPVDFLLTTDPEYKIILEQLKKIKKWSSHYKTNEVDKKWADKFDNDKKDDYISSSELDYLFY